MRTKYLILTFIFTIAFAGTFAHAQVRDTDIVLGISPQYPGSNQNVNATLNSRATDLDKANISWLVDGEDLSTGIGKKSFSFRTGGAGFPIILSATIDTIDGQNILKSITIIPADVDMLWEAYDSHVPPFYKGRSLASSQGQFKVVAMPNITGPSGKVNANNLSYLWIKDGKTQTNSSGWGKNYMILQNSYLDTENMAEVKVSDISGGTNASGKITLRTANPKIVFYKNNPLFGIEWGNALGNGTLIDSDGETIVAEPYFFSPKDIGSPGLSFDWFLSGNQISTPNIKNSLSIKPEEGQSGSATIRVDVNNINALFQSATKQINVQF